MICHKENDIIKNGNNMMKQRGAQMRYDCLIIDDEKELADNTCEYFNMFGVNTAAVYSGKEAEGFLADNEASIILLDINLSDGSGFELCKRIRQIIVLTI